MPRVRRPRLPGVRPERVDDDPWRGDGPPGRAPQLRARPGALSGLRVRDGAGAHRDAPPPNQRPAALPRERRPLPGPVPMRVPLSWLREFVEFDLTPEQLAD